MIPFKYIGTSIKRRAKGLANYVRYSEVFVISKFFSIYFAFTVAWNIVRYTEVRQIEVPALYRGETESLIAYKAKTLLRSKL